MAPLPEIDNTFRVTVNFTEVEGVKPVNVFHVHADGRTGEEVANGINDASIGLPLMNGVSDAFQPTTISILPLDGSSATGIYDLDEGRWSTESGSGDWSPATAAVVTLRTDQRGSRGRGRLYVGPLTEEAIDNGRVIGSIPGVLATAWQDFRDALEELPFPMELVVASYVHADQHRVSSINVSSIAGTQRRRQDQLRS